MTFKELCRRINKAGFMIREVSQYPSDEGYKWCARVAPSDKIYLTTLGYGTTAFKALSKAFKKAHE